MVLSQPPLTQPLAPLKQRLHSYFFTSEYKLPLPSRLKCMFVMVAVVICNIYIVYVCLALPQRWINMLFRVATWLWPQSY
jgi:hypothetical protein